MSGPAWDGCQLIRTSMGMGSLWERSQAQPSRGGPGAYRGWDGTGMYAGPHTITTAGRLESRLAQIIATVTDVWDEPLDEVYDIPPIVTALITAGVTIGREEATPAPEPVGYAVLYQPTRRSPSRFSRELDHPVSLDYATVIAADTRRWSGCPATVVALIPVEEVPHAE